MDQGSLEGVGRKQSLFIDVQMPVSHCKQNSGYRITTGVGYKEGFQKGYDYQFKNVAFSWSESSKL